MAVINYFDDILEEATKVEAVSGKNVLKDLVEKYINEKEDDSQLIEIYHADTDTTEYQKVEPDTYKVVAMVDGSEVPLDYIVEAEVVVSILFIPQSEKAWKVVGGILIGAAGIGLAIFGSVMIGAFGVGAGMFSSAGLTALGYASMIGGAALITGGLILANKGKKAMSSSDKDQKNLPYLSGAENEEILGKRYPFLLGKHLLSPYIAGSPYHVTKSLGSDMAHDGGQYIRVLYCLGYGPLKITDIKLGETVLAYNRSSDATQRDTILHGQLKGCGTNKDDGDITIKYKDNDITLEILQAGDKVKDLKGVSNADWDKYGTVYPTAVLEKEINANSLFVHDTDISKIQQESDRPHILYYNKSIPSGFRNNPVYMSSSCPLSIEVELDFNNGLFATRQENNNTKYYDIPMNLAVQWRFTGSGISASDAESPEGWNTFDDLYFANGEYEKVKYPETSVKPSPYTLQDRKTELERNFGLSEDKSENYNEKWIGANVFHLTQCENNIEYKQKQLTDEEIYNAIINEYLTSEEIDFTYTRRVPLKTYPYVTDGNETFRKNSYTVTPKGQQAGYYLVEQVENGVKLTVPCLNYTEQSFKPKTDEEYNINERRYVFRKFFTEEECRKLSGFTGDNILDLVEVRVIRLTPCYINQTGTKSDTYTDMTYQDLFTWTYLRTATFDKDAYLDALNNASNINAVRASNYPQRPQPIESDINNFVYLALEAKEDSTNSMGGVLNKLNVIAESFTPKYSILDKKWYPESVWEENKYYYKSDNGRPVEISTEEYEQKVIDDQEHYYKRRNGNDFISQIRNEIFTYDNLCTDEKGYAIVNPLLKYKIPDSVSFKYLSSNTASQVVHAITGSFLTNDSKTYDCIQMDKMAEFYEFCEDINDKTKQNYIGLPTNLVSSIDNCNPNRIHKGSDFRNAGYSEYDGSYGTDYAECWANEDGTRAVVVTCVPNNGNIITASRFKQLQAQWEIESLSDTSIIMAQYTGSNSIQKCEYYAQAYHMLIAAYFESHYGRSGYEVITNKFNSQGIVIRLDNHLDRAYEIFERLKDIPINALRNGVYKDFIKELNYVISKHDNFKVDDIYESYIIDILEQTVQNNQTQKLVKESDGYSHVRFECNGVITNEVKLETLVQKILLTGRSYLKRSDENKYEPLMGRPNPYPVTVLNQRNCISKSNTKSYEELPCGFQVSCIDEADNYDTNDFYVMANGESYKNPSAKIEQFAMDFVTNKWQLASLARFNLAAKLYQLESYTRTVGMLGYSISLGDTVLLQDDSLLIGTDRSGRIMELLEDDDNIYGFSTDEPFEYTGEIDPESKLCVQGCTVLQPSQKGGSRCVTLRCAKPDQSYIVGPNKYTMVRGLTNLFLLSTIIKKKTNKQIDMTDAANINEYPSEELLFNPKIDNVVAFGNVSSITSKAVVMQIKPSEKGQFTLSLVPYNEKIYESGFGMPVFKSNMTIQDKQQDYGFNDNVTQRNVVERVENIVDTNISALEKELCIKVGITDYTIEAIAKQDRIDLTANIPSTTSPNPGNTVQYVKWEILIPDPMGTVFIDGKQLRVYKTIHSTDTKASFYFDRKDSNKELAYPERKHIDEWRIRAVATNLYGVNSPNAETCIINTNYYGTWEFNFGLDNISAEVTNRTVYFNMFPSQAYNDKRPLYGTITYKVSIKRKYQVHDKNGPVFTGNNHNIPLYEEDEEYKGINLHSNPYPSGSPKDGDPDSYHGNEENYKTADSFTEVNSGFSQTLPLKGQSRYKYNPDGEREVEGEIIRGIWEDVDGYGMQNTGYVYKIIAENESGCTAIVDEYFIEAQCTSIVDVVHSHEYYKNLYVEKLSAINANVGLIKEGGFGNFTDWKNFWALSDLTAEEAETTSGVRAGTFRVGDEDEFISVIPPGGSIGKPDDGDDYYFNDTEKLKL